jgi:hypothetical protein
MGRVLNNYQRAGFETRKEYLEDLAEGFDIPYEKIMQIVDITGSDEDFDYLLVALDTISNVEDREHDPVAQTG